ncbi:hypothetical protein ACIQM0_23135 [Streptomyces sp. NPDC091387]
MRVPEGEQDALGLGDFGIGDLRERVGGVNRRLNHPFAQSLFGRRFGG